MLQALIPVISVAVPAVVKFFESHEKGTKRRKLKGRKKREVIDEEFGNMF